MKLIGIICPVLVCSMLSAQAPATPPPVPVAQPQEPENLDRMMSFGAYYWQPSGGPALRGGVKPVNTTSHDLNLPKKPYRAYGVMVTFPTKGNTRLELSYLTLNGNGDVTAPRDMGFFGGTVPSKEPLYVQYSLRHYKASWNYLTYPNPPQDAKFRLKTL